MRRPRAFHSNNRSHNRGNSASRRPLALLLSAALAAAAPARAAERALLLEVSINGHSTGKIETFTERDGMLYAPRADLEEFGLIVPPQAPQTADGLIALSTLTASVASTAPLYRMNEQKQSVDLTLPAASLKPNLLSANGLPLPTAGKLDGGRGAVLNYDAVVSHAAGAGNAASVLLDARAFAGNNTVTGGMIAQTGQAQGNPSFLRLDTTFSHGDPETQRRYSLGDFIGSGVTWSRPVRMFGAQIGTDFAMRPDLVTVPMPRLQGVAAVPSTVDVLVNDVRQISQSVAPGPFEVRQMPVPIGVGEVALTVQDAQGRTSVQRLPFYGSSRLLAEGRSTWSLEAGIVRHNYGSRSWDYGKPAASGSWRLGLTDNLTAETHAELTPRGSNLGGGLVYGMGNLGMVSAALAANLDGAGGLQGTLGYERVSKNFSFAASTTQAQASRRDIASANGDPVQRAVTRVSAGLPMGAWGNLSAAIAHTRAGTGMPQDANAATPAIGGATLLRSMTYSKGLFDRAQLFLTAYESSTPTGSNFGFFAGLSFTLGHNRSGSVNLANDGGRSSYSLQAAQPALAAGDFGWQSQVAGGAYRREQADVEYRLPYTHLTAGVDDIAGRTSARVGARGAIATVDGATMLAGPIQNSFAIVDTDGRAGVPVLYENRPAGITDSRGLLALTTLRPYDANRVAIDPLAVDADIEFNSSTQLLRPANFTGARVRFPMQHIAAALVTLVDNSDVWLPLGAEVVREDGTRTAIGHDGQVYLTGLAPRNQLRVSLPNGSQCIADFNYEAQPGDLGQIDHVLCAEVN